MSAIGLFEHLLTLLSDTCRQTVLPAKNSLDCFSQDDINALLSCGILQPASEAEMALCPGCEEQCIMPIEILLKSAPKEAKRFITCDKRDDISRVWVEPEHTLQWQALFPQVLNWLTSELGCTSETEALVDGCFWRLGQDEDQRFHYFLCRDNLKNTLQGNPLIRAKIAQVVNPIVFSLSPRLAEASESALILPLHQCITAPTAGLKLDKILLTETVRQVITSRATNDCISLHSDSYTVTHLGQEYRLAPRLFQLLHSIVSNRKNVITKDEIEKEMDADSGTIPIEQYLSKIRRILRSHGANADDLPIESITGKGYRLKSRYRFITIT